MQSMYFSLGMHDSVSVYAMRVYAVINNQKIRNKLEMIIELTVYN